MTDNKKEKTVGFYIFGIVELQDMFPFIMEAKKKHNCWVCYFDCFPTKRQFYYYSDAELVSLLKGVTVNIYRANDQKRHISDYANHKPTVVFIKSIKPKTCYWFPKADMSKVIHFNYMIETHHLDRPNIKVDLTLVHDKRWLNLYSNHKTAYFGDYRMANVKYVKQENFKKRCFIVESWLRRNSFKNKIINEESKFYDRLILFLKSRDYEIVWKKREKGFPKENIWASPLDYCKEMPDIIIEKDSQLPSSLFYYAYNSDICLFVNDCFAFFDTVKINPNSFILKSALYESRKYKFEEGWFDDFKESIFSFDQFVKREKLIENINKIDYDGSVVRNIIEYIV